MRKNIRRRYGFESGREINRTFLDDRSPHQKQMVYPKSEKDNFLTNFRKGLVIASVMWDNTRNRNGTDIFDRKKGHRRPKWRYG